MFPPTTCLSPPRDLVNPIADSPIGGQVKLSYVRDGAQKETSVTVQDRTKVFPDRAGRAGEQPDDNSPAEFGLRVEELTPERAHRVGMDAQKGVLVTEVDPASFADDVGFARGDLITEVNHAPVANVPDYRRAAAKLKPGQNVVFKVLRRQDAERILTLFLAGVVPAESQQ